MWNSQSSSHSCAPFSLADSSRKALAEVAVADVLKVQLKQAADAERRHIILEILGSLAESGETGITGGKW